MNKQKLLLAVLILVLAVASGALGQFAPPENIVSSKMLLSAGKLTPGGSFELTVRATAKSGYHVGAADKDALYPTTFTLSAPKGVTFDAPAYPKALRKTFPFTPKDKIPVYEGVFVIKVKGHVARNMKPGSVLITSKLDTQACKDDQCFPPQTTVSKLKVPVVGAGENVRKTDVGSAAASTSGGQDSAGSMATRLAKASPLLRFGLLYLGGLLLAFTPCVYPMIPVTVGYFGNQSGKKREAVALAAVYVLGLALTYAILGAIAASTGGLFGAAMQSKWVILGIAAVLVALAFSMFGLFDLKPPAFIHAHAHGKDGMLGALIMGLIFGIVCAPCVGPVVLGLLLYVAKIGSPVMGFLLFFVMALGLGTPLFFLAVFSAEMPVPGMWMVAVKKFAGFLLLGAAAYFILPLVPDSVGRLLIPLVLLAAGIYMGFMEKSLKANRISASAGKVFGVAALVVAVMMVVPGLHTVGARPEKALSWEPYSASAVANAVKAHRPVMIDFTAKWCAVCKELEEGPFSDPQVMRAAGKFTRFRVDGTMRDAKIQAAESKYNVHGYPAVIFFDSSGKEARSARVVKFVSTGDMLARIRLVK